MGKVAQTAQPHRGSSRRSSSARMTRARTSSSCTPARPFGGDSESAGLSSSSQRLQNGSAEAAVSSPKVAHEILQHQCVMDSSSLDDLKASGSDADFPNDEGTDHMDPDWQTVSGRKRLARSPSPSEALAEFLVEVSGRPDFRGDLCFSIARALRRKLGESGGYSIFPIRERTAAVVSFRTPKAYAEGIHILDQDFLVVHDDQSTSSSSLKTAAMRSQSPEPPHPTDAPRPPRPSKRLILRPIGQMNPLNEVRHVLDSYTNLIRYNVMKGSRGDVIITFCSPKAVLIASEAFRTHGDGLFEIVPQRAKTAPWTSTKKTWEVKIALTPSELDAKSLCDFVQAEKFWILPRSRDLVLSFRDKELAAKFVREGIFFSDYFLRAVPFTSKPKEFRIPKKTCKACLTEHSGECSNTPMCKCGSTAHTTSSCPKAQEALSRKRKSYRAALLGETPVDREPRLPQVHVAHASTEVLEVSPQGSRLVSNRYRGSFPGLSSSSSQAPTEHLVALVSRLEERLSALETTIESLLLRLAASLEKQQAGIT